ncbi:MAG: hypothetical protein Q4G64_04340, partial [bacterium]|nr:hypothetical protein [bacterium]
MTGNERPTNGLPESDDHEEVVGEVPERVTPPADAAGPGAVEAPEATPASGLDAAGTGLAAMGEPAVVGAPTAGDDEEGRWREALRRATSGSWAVSVGALILAILAGSIL